MDSIYCDYEDFINRIAHINWLDPSDSGTDAEKEAALTEMWNFLCEQERKEEELYGDSIEEFM